MKTLALTPVWQRRLEILLVLALCVAGLYVRLQAHADGRWAFAGSDSVGYAKLGHELHEHGRYALAPPPEPLAWVRPPLYPIFLSVVFPSGDVFHASWTALFVLQIGFDLLSGLLAYALARRMAGPVAGLLALALTEINPFTPLFSLAMLTETLATLLSTAAVATIVLGAERPRRWWPLGGALVALATLLRPDGLLCAVAFGPALVLSTLSRRDKWVACGVAALGFVVLFAPWPIRNTIQFHNPHPLGGRIDRYTRPVANYEGYWSWLRTWSRDWEGMTTPTTCFYDNGCDPNTLNDLRRRGAFVDIDDEKEVRALIAERFRSGLTPAVSDGFQKIADAHRRAHPLLVEVGLPLTRAWYMWHAPFDELLQGRPPWIWRQLRPYLRRVALVQLVAWLVAGALLSWRRRTRLVGGALLCVIVARTLIMGFTFYSMPRYSIEVMPLAFALVAGGLVVLGGEAGAWVRRRRARAA